MFNIINQIAINYLTPTPPCVRWTILAAYPNLIPSCSFDKTATGPIIAFETFIILGTVAALWLLARWQDKLWQRYLIMAGGVFIFQLFTAPMWDNHKLGSWAYLYQDVSWILTMGWTTLALSTVILVDRFLAQLRWWLRFILYLVILTLVVLILEGVVVNLGIRSYAPEVEAAFSGYTALGVHVEVFYYVPVFMALIIGFYKYWSLVLDHDLIVPVKKQRWLASLIISVAGVFLFELMIEPMVVNANLPGWSYIYRDVSLLMTGLWVVLIWLVTHLVDRLLIHLGLAWRFLLYLGAIGVLILPVEAWFINNGYRIYGPSAVANFSGFTTVITNIPVEVAFAIPLYLALVIAFIRYWEIGLSNS